MLDINGCLMFRAVPWNVAKHLLQEDRCLEVTDGTGLICGIKVG